MPIIFEATIRVTLDLDTIRGAKDDSDLVDHILKSVKRTGDRHPEDPLFDAVDEVKLLHRKWYRPVSDFRGKS